MRTLLAAPLEVESTWSGTQLRVASRANTDHTGHESTSAATWTLRRGIGAWLKHLARVCNSTSVYIQCGINRQTMAHLLSNGNQRIRHVIARCC